MAIVSKKLHVTGTIGDITLYRWEDRIFARKKSSLTAERVLKDKAFAGLRKHAGDMGRASKIASEVYRSLPADIKGRWIFRAIAGYAASLFYKGKSEQQVRDALNRKYLFIPVSRDKRSVPGKLTGKKGNSGLITNVSSKTANKHWMNIFLKDWENQGKDISYFYIAWEHRQRFNPYTVPRRSEYFLGLEHASGL
jgi:hypothetical protein